MNIYLTIKEHYPNYTKTDKSIADYLLSQHDDLASMTAQSIAQCSGTSAAAVVRFVKKIGLSGLSDLRIRLVRDERDSGGSGDLLVTPDQTLDELADKLDEIITGTPDKVLGLNTTAQLSAAITRIATAGTVYLFGTGTSGLVAEDLYMKLLRINKRAVFAREEHMQLRYATHAGQGDAALIFSHSGQTKSVRIILDSLRERGVPIIGVTKAERSPLSQCADLVLTLPSGEAALRIGAIRSRYAALMLSDLLFMGVAQGEYTEMESALKKTKEILDKFNERG